MQSKQQLNGGQAKHTNNELICYAGNKRRATNNERRVTSVMGREASGDGQCRRQKFLLLFEAVWQQLRLLAGGCAHGREMEQAENMRMQIEMKTQQNKAADCGIVEMGKWRVTSRWGESRWGLW
ncbi:uncharacterized protein LOC129238550 [Anastrepha obliqua]|uniref:uncharacterized protein LOC129238550 n=1 Tax=Anastrepha obliqua TaxID=95512 RepID=UPI002409BCF2|nr:uncharacterized protein LOC129238550 [Anastrepha obliqua]